MAGTNENDPDFVRASQRVGQVLRGKYRIDRVIGVGGMAAVYAATHRNQKTFAVKVLHRELSFNDDVRNRFLREGYAANSVRHPGAVAVLDDDVAEDGAAFLVMELLDGLSVESLVEQHGGRLTAAYVLGIGHQLLDTLAAAHAQGIVHRDIKPANLFLTREGQVKVLDFGIARVRDAATSGSSVTGTGVLLGTPAFMAPEQALGKSSEIDAQTDLWTVGATLFNMTTGDTVHQGETGTHLMVLAATTPSRPLASVLPSAPAPLAAIVDRALSFAKAGRWPSAEAMRDALRDASLAMFGRLPLRETLLPAFGDSAVAMAATRPVDAAMIASFGLAPPGAQGVGEPPPTQPMGPSGSWVPPTQGPSGPWPDPGPAGRSVPATQMATGAGAAVLAAQRAPPMQTGPGGYPLPLGGIAPTVGMTTSQPVASEAESSRPAGVPRSTPALLAIAAVVGFLVVGGGAFVALRAMGGSSAPDTASSGSVPLGAATAPASTGEAIPPSATAPPAAATGPSAERPALPVPAPLAPAAASAKPRLAPPPTPPPPQAPVAVAVPTALPAAAPAGPVCKVVSFFDADGNKHFRQECH